MNENSTLFIPTKSVRENSIELLRYGFVKFSQTQTNFELTDFLSLISVYYDAAIELGVDPIDFFNKIITEIQNQELIIAVNNFLRRPLDEKKIAAWGYSKLYYPEFEYFEKL